MDFVCSYLHRESKIKALLKYEYTPLKCEFSFFINRQFKKREILSGLSVIFGLAITYCITKVKVGVLRPIQQPGSYWDRSSELPLVGLEPTEVTAYD